MLSIAALLLFLGLAVLGWGALLLAVAARLFGCELQRGATLGDLGACGFLALAMLGAAVNFLLPLDGIVATLAVAIGFAGLALCRRRVMAAWNGFSDPRVTLAVLVLAALLAAWTISPGDDTNYDDGLYHLQTMLTSHDSRVVFGLSQLHDRLAFDSTWLIALPLLALPRLGLSGALIGGAILAVFVVAGFWQRTAAAMQEGGSVPTAVYGMAALAVLPTIFGKLGLDNAGTDLAPVLLTLAIGQIGLALIDSPVGGHRAEDETRLFLIIVCAVFVATLKLSHAPVALAPLALLPLAIGRRQRPGAAVFAGAAVAFALVAVWCLRNLAQSGCLVYPIPFTCIAVLPWTIRHADAENSINVMRGWSRVWNPHDLDAVLRGWDWVGGWFLRAANSDEIVPPLILVALALVFLAFRLLRRDRFRTAYETMPPGRRRFVWALVAVMASGMPFVFFTAPDLRYALGTMTGFALLLMALSAPVAVTMPRTYRALGAILGACAVFGLQLAPVVPFDRALLIRSDWPRIPAPTLVQRAAADGTMIYQPVGTDQCWAAPRPCTPNLFADLEFKRLGLWRMIVHR
ncbi:MAG TPA: hypothetical protein VGP48_07370 [Stellaceae bacterium]|jgi:hypothetical protein|nr:hypothetical protein [Stellaceae bacterium]